MISRIVCLPIIILLLVSLPVSSFAGNDVQRTYTPSPGKIIIYNADMAQLTQGFTVNGDEPFKVDLPSALLPNTLRVKVNGIDVSRFALDVIPVEGQSYNYNYNYYSYNPYYSSSSMPEVNSYGLEWDNSGLDGAKVELSYLAHGISWEPRYICDINDSDTVHFNYAAAIDNKLLDLEDCEIKLLSGVVAGINQSEWNNMNQTQRAGLLYNAMSEGSYGGSMEQVTLNIHEIYEIGVMDLEAGKMTCITLFNDDLENERQFIWDARTDNKTAGKVKVIYKIMNESEMPFAAGNVAMYEDDVFLGMDPMELTPPGSPGHITMGESMDFRVFRYEKTDFVKERPAYLPNWVDRKVTVTLEIRYFGEKPGKLDILDDYRFYDKSLIVREDGSPAYDEDTYDPLLRFAVNMKKGDKKTVEYIYYTN